MGALRRSILAGGVALLTLGSGCGGGGGFVAAPSAAALATWTARLPVTRPVDIVGPRRDGRLLLAAAAHLALWRAGTAPVPFAGGASGYSAAGGGGEPYLALARGQRVTGAGCSFRRDSAYVLALGKHPGVVAVDRGGRARRFASIAGAGLLDGIAFDETGRFGHRLLVTRSAAARTTVFALDCRGRVAVLTRGAPRVEGGIAVAPASFGRFAGDLIAPDENSGRIFAIAADGRSRLLADSGVARGGDVGVESAGFVPAGFAAGWSALLADRATPGNPHPGDDVILALGASSLAAAGVRPGDLLVASEGGARTVAVRCAAACVVRHVADGPAVAHAEGHIAFARGA